MEYDSALLLNRPRINKVGNSFELALLICFNNHSLKNLNSSVVLYLTHLCDSFALVRFLDKEILQRKRIFIECLAEIRALNELLAVSGEGSLVDLGVRGVQSSVKDVLLQVIVEELRLLHDKTKALTELNNVILAHIDIIDEDSAELGVVEAHDKTNEGRLALTRFTNNGDSLFRLNGKVEALEDPLVEASGVAEPNILELNLATEAIRNDFLLLLELRVHDVHLGWNLHDFEDLEGSALGLCCIRAHRHRLSGSEGAEDDKEHRDILRFRLGVLVLGPGCV